MSDNKPEDKLSLLLERLKNVPDFTKYMEYLKDKSDKSKVQLISCKPDELAEIQSRVITLDRLVRESKVFLNKQEKHL